MTEIKCARWTPMDYHGHVATSRALDDDQIAGITRRFFFSCDEAF